MAVSRVFQKSFKEDCKVFQASFRYILKKFEGCFKVFQRKCQGCFKVVSLMFKESFQASEKSHVEMHSSLLPEQKEDLFYKKQ